MPGQVAGGADERVVVQDVEDAGDLQQHVVVVDHRLGFHPLHAEVAAGPAAVAGLPAVAVVVALPVAVAATTAPPAAAELVVVVALRIIALGLLRLRIVALDVALGVIALGLLRLRIVALGIIALGIIALGVIALGLLRLLAGLRLPIVGAVAVVCAGAAPTVAPGAFGLECFQPGGNVVGCASVERSLRLGGLAASGRLGIGRTLGALPPGTGRVGLFDSRLLGAGGLSGLDRVDQGALAHRAGALEAQGRAQLLQLRKQHALQACAFAPGTLGRGFDGVGHLLPFGSGGLRLCRADAPSAR